MQSVQFDRPLIDKYNIAGPRYTSYPTVLQFSEDFDNAAYADVARASNQAQPLPDLSLYFHLPFCARLCYYCACNKIITNKRSMAAPYLSRLHEEIARQADLYDGSREVAQLHWGGGTPTFISSDETRELMAATRRHFQLKDDSVGEYSIEIDPREVREDTLATLREVGFNRMSLGIQDFDPKVQKAVNRKQSEELTASVINEARALGFRSISVDLIYGLPFQTLQTISETLDKVITLSPDRISIYNYAHLPERFPTQAKLRSEDMPTAPQKLDILKLCIDQLTAAGYAYIGMDHFAKKTDSLYLAQQNGTLYRNFQGYSTHAECDLIGMGVTAIGTVDGNFYQNIKELDAYQAAIDSGTLAVAKGLRPSQEDRIRRNLIMQLICHFKLDFDRFGQQWGLNFNEHFAHELALLQPMADDGLLTLSDQQLEVTGRGRLLIRNICMQFDQYLQPQQLRFSKAI